MALVKRADILKVPSIIIDGIAKWSERSFDKTAMPKPPPTVTPTIPPISVPLNYRPVSPSIDPHSNITPIRPPVNPHPRPPMVPPPRENQYRPA